MSTNYDYDFFVIGCGSGGVRAARMAGATGAKVGIAEGEYLGGTCVNVGCIPKKLYSYASGYAQSFQEAEGYGWSKIQSSFDWETLKRNRAKEISRLNGIYKGLLDNADVVLYREFASFIDEHTVKVGEQTITAKNILIATGGWPVVPEIEGKEFAITSNEIFDMPIFPKRLAVVGGGYIASEFASIFNGLGSEVVQFVRRDHILRGFDEDVRRFTEEQMLQQGVDIRFETQVEKIEKKDDGLHLSLNNGQSVVVDEILYATGRAPRVADLALDKVGVKLAENDAILVDENYKTNIDSIYALGDVTDRVQLTPVAIGEAMQLVDHLFGDKQRQFSYEFIPTAVFTSPNIGTVGYSEHEAREQFKDITVYRSNFKGLKHTLSGLENRTLMKLIVEDKTDRVVGMHMVGEDAGEIIQGFAVALKAGATKAVFDSTVGIHPTAAEEFVTMRTPVSE